MGTVQAAELEVGRKPEAGGGRLRFIDNLRLTMIILVLLFHLAATYGPFSYWYYDENVGKAMLGPVTSIFFIMFCSATQAFFMGVLFFIAGYFVPAAYDRKGGSKFIIDRLERLGIPALVYMLLLHPLTIMILRYYKHGDPTGVLWEYPHYLASFKFLGSSGPLWFAVALLIFSAVYAGVRSLMEHLTGRRPPAPESAAPLTHGAVCALILGVAAVTFLVRLVQPFGSFVLNLQLCSFTQYVTLFMLGALAYRRDFLTRLATAFGMEWFKCALMIGLPCLFALVLPQRTDLSPCYGGWRWQAAVYALWEAFFCAGICLGLLVLFRDRGDRQGRFTAFLSRNAFAVYVFHAPIMVWLTVAARHLYWHPALKWLAASAVITPLCFLFSAAIRTIPLCRKIFS